MAEEILVLKDITKIFPGVVALSKVNFILKKGEIHALIGENGAGKSTFIKVITGVHKPDGGEMYVIGEKVEFNNTKESAAMGIAAIYQHSTSFPDMTVTENIFMGHEQVGKFSRLKKMGMKKKAQELINSVTDDINVDSLMKELSVAQQQMVEIAKALSVNASIIIMDEPTASLTKKESAELYKICRNLKDIGTSIIFISHRFVDIFSIADTITILRDGTYIGTWPISEISESKMIEAMVGREISQQYPKKEIVFGKEILRVEGLSRLGFFDNVSFNVRSGEILALTGLIGAGRSEVAECIYGINKADKGNVFLEDNEINISHPSQALNLGIGYLSEDRHDTGLILDMEIGDNIMISVLDKYKKGIGYDKKSAYIKADELKDKLSIKTPSICEKVESLSGGNQQKVCVAKQLTRELKVLIIDEPTKGIDVISKAAIYEIISDLAEKGVAIIMISSEMEETLFVSDRIIVMREGLVTGEFIAKESDQITIMNASMSK